MNRLGLLRALRPGYELTQNAKDAATIEQTRAAGNAMKSPA
jgi:hypothetical protein